MLRLHLLPVASLPIVLPLLTIPAAPRTEPAGTLVIAVARDISTPVPTLWSDQPNREISDLIFLRLADLGPRLSTSGDRDFVPRLARRWERRDPLTLVFELDPRARWHDGVPVTAGDVVFTLERARNPRLSPQSAALLRRLRSVTAEGESRIVVRFSEPYAEQFYDVTYHVPLLPAHLLAQIPPDSLARSAFMDRPVGNGPYTFVRRTPGQSLELAADTSFFLGRPGIRRILVLIARDPEARVNLLLTEAADALDNIYSFQNSARVEGLPAYQYFPVPGSTIQYADFNGRDPADTSRPHPIFADPMVRRALAQAIDRERIGHGAYGPLARIPEGPLSALLLRNVDAPQPLPYDTAAARRLLASRGWLDRDGDGTLDRDGRPLTFRVMVPSVVAARVKMATEMQEAWRQLGIRAELDLVEPSVFLDRRRAGRYDLELQGVTQDPSPSGLAQSWSCGGVSNVAHYCNRAVDSLLDRAVVSAPERMTRLYSEAVRRLADDAPAIFLAAPVFGTPVHRRFTNVILRPESNWALVWQWKLRPGQEIERDRQ
jgi:peptide/nickel transport system substrate-binding protein